MLFLSVYLLSAALGIMAWIVFLATFGIAIFSFLYSLLCGLLLRRHRWLVWIPIPVAAVGLTLCLLLSSVEASVFCVLWGLVALAALAGAVIGILIRKIGLYITGWIHSDPAPNSEREEEQCAADSKEEIWE